jgi:hypothetical protein
LWHWKVRVLNFRVVGLGIWFPSHPFPWNRPIIWLHLMQLSQQFEILYLVSHIRVLKILHMYPVVTVKKLYHKTHWKLWDDINNRRKYCCFICHTIMFPITKGLIDRFGYTENRNVTVKSVPPLLNYASELLTTCFCHGIIVY